MTFRFFRRRLEVSSSVGRAYSSRRYDRPFKSPPYRRIVPRPVVSARDVVSRYFRDRLVEVPIVRRPVRESSRRLEVARISAPTAFARAAVAPPVRRSERIVARHGERRLSFFQPRLVLTCLRRKMRREVLHALGVAGRKGLRGRGGGYHRRVDSQFSC